MTTNRTLLAQANDIRRAFPTVTLDKALAWIAYEGDLNWFAWTYRIWLPSQV